MERIVPRTPSRRQGAFALLLIAIVLLLLGTRGAARSNASFSPADHPTESGLSVMTYNVEGLPWPIRWGRANALADIGERLGAMRAEGRQPKVVLLQEAFSDDARAIRAASGYRYAAFGPASGDAGSPATSSADRAFQAESGFLKGERSGKLLDSGLIILSDYPILSVRRAAFPDYACAGYDCLANKGMVMAVVAPPGAPGPIAIVNLHLNSKKASGVSLDRANAAFRRQVAAVDAFLNASIAPDMPVIVAGDFNIGRNAERRAIVESMLARQRDGRPRDAFSLCLEARRACDGGRAPDALLSRARAKDWQFMLPGADSDWAVSRIATPFGREADGSMLSDHVGYTAYLELAKQGDDQPSPRG